MISRKLRLEPLGISEQKAKSDSITPIEKPTIDTSIDDLIVKANTTTKRLFEDIRARIFKLDENIKEKATTSYVAYRVTKNFAEIHIGKNQLKIHLRPVDYVDERGIVEKVPEGYQWTMDRRVYLKSEEDMDYVFGLIEQSYKDVL